MANTPRPRPAPDALDFFVGDWRIETESIDEGGSVTHKTAMYSIRRDAGDAWLVGNALVGQMIVRDLWGWDPEKGEFVRIQFFGDGSRGELRSQGWQGDHVTWVGGGVMADGSRNRVRTTQTKKTADTFTVTWEIFEFGRWRTYGRELLTRVQ